MTVEELIEELKNFDPESEVHFSYDYGDHWHTEVAPEIFKIEETTIVWSDYHHMPKLADVDDGHDSDTAKLVVVIS